MAQTGAGSLGLSVEGVGVDAGPAGTAAGPLFVCPSCGKTYRHHPSLWKHRKYECGQEPQFQCPLCPHRAKRKHHLVYHLQARHGKAT